MGCNNSKAAIAKNAKEVKGKKHKVGDSSSSVDSLDKDRNKKGGDCENDSELSDEEIEQLEKEQREQIWVEKENLRDNMTNLELVLNMLAEATTTEISKEKKPKNFNENKVIAKQGGTIAGNTRKAIEAKSGKKIVSPQNAKQLKQERQKKELK